MHHDRKTRTKFGLIGAGSIGSALGLMIVERGLGDVMLLDVNEGMAKGKALDVAQAQAVDPKGDFTVEGTSCYDDLEGSDVIVVTAGKQRQFGPGLSRDDLLDSNSLIVQEVAHNIKKVAPEAFVIVVTNPLDAVTHVMARETGFHKSKVVGMAGVLDTTRFRHFLAKELGVSQQDVHTMVLGGHGDSMVPLISATTVGGTPLKHMVSSGVLPEDRLAAIIHRTRDGGGEIGRLMKPFTTFNAPAVSILAMAEAYLYDKKRILPCAARLEGEYGIEGLHIGVPCVIGAGGVERIVEYPLEKSEQEMFNHSVETVRALLAKLKI
eukprot:CAMPEP_0167820404 /NCGR_PEP_ID=MMETSP0112_2-20121227/6066_1 /TAXON_ID=91324 /ORGANISM="Lotharella globosa, Strain CCCM811" /LENGTH=322 /DNA_ID=CAMNT_0007720945 /DNA_START=222 /DNA_END=1190 /DNA_ORIENTATION=-